MANEGFAQIRNGLKEHIEAGKLCPTDLGVYTFLHLYCDYATGIYTGTALGIAYRFGDATQKNLIQHSLNRLRKSRFINYRIGNGKRGGYAILIDKYEPTFGALRGRRLNAWKYEDKVQPAYGPLRGQSDGQSDSGVTVESQSSDSGVTVEPPYPYLQTGKQEDFTYEQTTTEPSLLSKTSPTDSTGEKEPEEPARLVPVNIRDWPTTAFGVSAERLRNCLTFVLDFREDDYYRRNPPTVASMSREAFVRKLVQDTPPNWTPELAKEAESAPKTWSDNIYQTNDVVLN